MRDPKQKEKKQGITNTLALPISGLEWEALIITTLGTSQNLWKKTQLLSITLLKAHTSLQVMMMKKKEERRSMSSFKIFGVCEMIDDHIRLTHTHTWGQCPNLFVQSGLRPKRSTQRLLLSRV
jgi:hypothetical protein